VEVGVSSQLRVAEMRELLEVEVHGFVAKRQEGFEARGSGCVKLDGVGQGRDVVGGCGRRTQVCENVVVPIAIVLGEVCFWNAERTTHEGLARSRKMWTLNVEGDRSPEEVRWWWKIEWNEPFSAGEDREAASGSNSSSMSEKREMR